MSLSRFAWYFRVLGISTYSNNPTTQIRLISWSIFNLVILSTIVVVVSWFNKYLFYVGTAVGYMTDIMQVVAPFMAHYAMIFEGIFCRRLEHKMLEKVQRIDNILQTNDEGFSKTLHFKITVANIVCTIMDIFVVISTNKLAPEWSYLSLARTFPFIVTRFGVLQMIMFVEFLHTRVKILRLRIQSAKTMPKSRHIKNLHKCFLTMWKLCSQIETRFGWSILGCLVNYFVCTTVNVYWIYSKLTSGKYRFITGI